jgi:putative peptidoglycan lipid II flippase
MSRHWAAGQPDLAHRAQNQAMALTLALSMPFVIAFVLVPEAIMRYVLAAVLLLAGGKLIM